MSRLFRQIVTELQASKTTQSLACTSNLTQRFEAHIKCEVAVATSDLAALATLLAKRPGHVKSSMIEAGVSHFPGVEQQFLQKLCHVAFSRFKNFSPAEATELLHALSRDPGSSKIRERLSDYSSQVQQKVVVLEPRGLALVANSYVRAQLYDAGVFRQIARRGTEIMTSADGQTAASLAHAFARLRKYHHALFTVLKDRLVEVSGELQSAEVAQCLFAFAQSLPPPRKSNPLEYAFDREKGFGQLFDMLLEQMKTLLAADAASVTQQSALLALQAFDRLQLRDEQLLANLFDRLCWEKLNVAELCMAVHAAACLEVMISPAPILDLVYRTKASNAQICILVSSCNLLQYAVSPGFGSIWSSRARAAWIDLLGRVSAAALVRKSGEQSLYELEAEGGAAPHVALSCLVLLPPFTGCLTKHVKLQEARHLIQFARFMSTHKSARTALNELTISEMQLSVEFILRRISALSAQDLQLQGEVKATPFWIDVVVQNWKPLVL